MAWLESPNGLGAARSCRPPGAVSILFFGENGKIINPQIARISPIQPNCRFEFHKRGQLFIRLHNEAFSIVGMRVSNADCLPARIHG